MVMQRHGREITMPSSSRVMVPLRQLLQVHERHHPLRMFGQFWLCCSEGLDSREDDLLIGTPSTDTTCS